MNATQHKSSADTGASSADRNPADRSASPGEILREGRLAHDYSVQDLCAQTKLSARTVEALENNDFDALSQPVFARGYYRQCAKVLDLDTNRLMTAYAVWAGEPGASPGPAEPSAPAEPGRSAGVSKIARRSPGAAPMPRSASPRAYRLRGLIVLLGLAAVAVAAIIFLVPSMGIPSLSLGSGGNQDSAASASPPAAASTEGGNRAQRPTTDSPKPDNDTPVANGDKSATSNTPAKAGGGSANPSSAANPPKPGNTAGQTAEQTGDSGEPDARSASSVPSNRLELTFTKRSWVQVVDARGNRIASGIFTAGDKKQYRGQPPYKITLGFAPGVEVSIGGRRVDVAKLTGGAGVAHITVDAPANNR